MKKYLIALVGILLLSSCATKSNFSSFYKSNRSESDFSINAPAFFVNVFVPKEDLGEYKDLIKNVKKYKVMTFSKENERLERNFRRLIKNGNYASVLKVNEDGEKVDIYFLNDGETIKEIILRVKSDDEYVLLGLKTNLLQKKLNTFLNSSVAKVN
jgi:hypothetical protein